MDAHDYLVDHSAFDWQKLLSTWEWLLDEEVEVQPWLMNRFGDLFFVDELGIVLWLNITDGELSEVASSVDEFFEILDSEDGEDGHENEDEDDSADWFLTGFVDEIVAGGKTLGPNQCYGFRTLPVLGGEYELDNVYISSIEDYWSFCGKVHSQIHDLPDGAEVEIDLPGH